MSVTIYHFILLSRTLPWIHCLNALGRDLALTTFKTSEIIMLGVNKAHAEGGRTKVFAFKFS